MVRFAILRTVGDAGLCVWREAHDPMASGSTCRCLARFGNFSWKPSFVLNFMIPLDFLEDQCQTQDFSYAEFVRGQTREL